MRENRWLRLTRLELVVGRRDAETTITNIREGVDINIEAEIDSGDWWGIGDVV